MNRRKIAEEHHALVLKRDALDTSMSVICADVYTEPLSSIVEVLDTDCVSAAIRMQEAGVDETNITILNFASFHEPGGGYIRGAWAQEESLCSESNLWEILNADKFKPYFDYNRKHHNDGLYEDRAIITFVKFVRDDKEYTFNVITCASPNYKNAILKHSHDEIVEVYRNRLKFIYNILIREGQEVLIAGAWGCGVFGFPRDVSQQLFKETATVNTVLAIPSDPKFINKRSSEV